MSSSNYCTSPLVLVLEPYTTKNSSVAGLTTHYVWSLKKEHPIITKIRKGIAAVKAFLGLQKKLIPQQEAMTNTSNVIGIRISASEYAKLTNGCEPYINTSRHLAPKALILVPKEGD